SWQAIFWINVPLALVAVPFVLRALPESFGRREPLDVAGLVLGGTGVLAGVWAITRGNEHGWTSASVMSGLVAGALLLIGFVWREAHAPHPLMPLRLFRSRSFTVANIAGFAFSLGM